MQAVTTDQQGIATSSPIAPAPVETEVTHDMGLGTTIPFGSRWRSRLLRASGSISMKSWFSQRSPWCRWIA
jgi:hypothetical protein